MKCFFSLDSLIAIPLKDILYIAPVQKTSQNAPPCVMVMLEYLPFQLDAMLVKIGHVSCISKRLINGNLVADVDCWNHKLRALQKMWCEKERYVWCTDGYQLVWNLLCNFRFTYRMSLSIMAGVSHPSLLCFQPSRLFSRQPMYTPFFSISLLQQRVYYISRWIFVEHDIVTWLTLTFYSSWICRAVSHLPL